MITRFVFQEFHVRASVFARVLVQRSGSDDKMQGSSKWIWWNESFEHPPLSRLVSILFLPFCWKRKQNKEKTRIMVWPRSYEDASTVLLILSCSPSVENDWKSRKRSEWRFDDGCMQMLVQFFWCCPFFSSPSVENSTEIKKTTWIVIWPRLYDNTSSFDIVLFSIHSLSFFCRYAQHR